MDSAGNLSIHVRISLEFLHVSPKIARRVGTWDGLSLPLATENLACRVAGVWSATVVRNADECLFSAGASGI